MAKQKPFIVASKPNKHLAEREAKMLRTKGWKTSIKKYRSVRYGYRYGVYITGKRKR